MLTGITSRRIRVWHTGLTKHGLGASTTAKAYHLLRGILNTAVDDELIKKNRARSRRRDVGVQRQHTGTAGRIENSQIAVYLAYATTGGHAFIDRELYLPKTWTADPVRCHAAGVPQARVFTTKGELAARMVVRALESGLCPDWVTGDEVYGQSPHLRTELEERQVGYVFAVASSHRVTTRAGTYRADEMTFALPQRAWQRLSAGAGAKDHRFYDWAFVDVIKNYGWSTRR